MCIEALIVRKDVEHSMRERMNPPGLDPIFCLGIVQLLQNAEYSV